MVKLTNITLSGYKSIEHMSLDLRSLNVLIGPNGAGKSNFLSFFDLMSEMMDGCLQFFIGHSGKAHSFLFYGPKTTEQIQASLRFRTECKDEYNFRLAYSAGDTLTFASEKFKCEEPGESPELMDLGSGHVESRLQGSDFRNSEASTVESVLRGCKPLQFHDTSATSGIRSSTYINDNTRLQADGGNLAAILYTLQQTQKAAYRQIIQTIRQVVPRFKDFVLGPLKLDEDSVLLNWREEGANVTFGPHQLSDGSLRAMALITLLLQPPDPLQPIIVIDEPELGLHPHAIVVLAALIKEAACRRQIIVATQSTCLLDQFETEDVIVVDRDGRGSTFKRLEEEKLKEWLEEYLLSELWEKNVLGGGPV